MEFSQQAANFIESCKISISKKFIDFKMKSHPHYPSLLSLADTLDVHNPVKLTPSYRSKLTYLLAGEDYLIGSSFYKRA
jgi:hypothetical protein